MRAHVRVDPAEAVPVGVMQRIQGRSSRRIRTEFPELRKRYWGQCFWARGYFSTTSGNVTDDIIIQYLESHSSNDGSGICRKSFT